MTTQYKQRIAAAYGDGLSFNGYTADEIRAIVQNDRALLVEVLELLDCGLHSKSFPAVISIRLS